MRRGVGDGNCQRVGRVNPGIACLLKQYVLGGISQCVNMLEMCCDELLRGFVNIETSTHKQEIDDGNTEGQPIAQLLLLGKCHGKANANRLSNLQWHIYKVVKAE